MSIPFKLRDEKGRFVKIPSFLTPPAVEKYSDWYEMIERVGIRRYLKDKIEELNIIKSHLKYWNLGTIPEKEYYRAVATALMNYTLLIMAKTYVLLNEKERSDYAKETKEIAEKLKELCRNVNSCEDYYKVIDFIRENKLIPPSFI